MAPTSWKGTTAVSFAAYTYVPKLLKRIDRSASNETHEVRGQIPRTYSMASYRLTVVGRVCQYVCIAVTVYHFVAGTYILLLYVLVIN